MKGVYRFYWDCGDYGEVYGIFTADSEDVDKAIGRDVDFGYITGKDQHVDGTLSDEDITLVSADLVVVSMVESLGLTIGYNPLDYLKESEE